MVESPVPFTSGENCASAVADLQPNVLLFGKLEISALSLHVVAANGKIRGHVLTDVVGGQMSDITSINVGDRDRNIRYGRA